MESSIAVSISPGETALTSTPFLERSRESARVNPSSPAFDAAYPLWPGSGILALGELMLMIRPHPRSSIPLVTALVQ